MSSPSASKPAAGGRRCAPGGAVVAEPGRGVLDRAQHHAGAAVVERVGQVDLRPAPLRARGSRPSELRNGGADRHRVHGRAVVVDDARHGQLGAAGAAADRRLGLEHGDRDPSRARAAAQASPLGPEPTTTAAGLAGRWMTSTGKSQDSSSQGRGLSMSATLTQPSSTQAARGVVDPVALALDVGGLGLEGDHPHVASAEPALLLHGVEQLLVVEVAVAEVPAGDDARDQLALAHVVVLDVVDRAGSSPFRARPWLCMARNARPPSIRYSAVSSS